MTRDDNRACPALRSRPRRSLSEDLFFPATCSAACYPRLRLASTPFSRLVIVESGAPRACIDERPSGTRSLRELPARQDRAVVSRFEFLLLSVVPDGRTFCEVPGA